MASAVAVPQANDLIANGASEPCVADTPASSCAGTVARTAAGTVRLFARSALPPWVAYAVTAALAYSVPAVPRRRSEAKIRKPPQALEEECHAKE